MRYPVLMCVIISAFAFPAVAQIEDTRELNDRMERIERDIGLMQRQVSRRGITTTADRSGAPITNSAQLDVRLQQVDEEMRKLAGEVERAQFQNKQLSEKLEKYMSDAEFRFQELEKTKLAATEPKPVPHTPAELPEEVIENKSEPKNFTNAKDQYDHAFKLLREAKHEEAGREFEAFVKKYPADALTGNAYYWLGETYYVRRNYVKSADFFRQGFKTAPAGPKAADNLLKLAMSLSAQQKTKEACVVLLQVEKKYAATSPGIKDKTAAEIERNDCR